MSESQAPAMSDSRGEPSYSLGLSRSQMSGLPSPGGSALLTPGASHLTPSQDVQSGSQRPGASSQLTPSAGRPELGYYVNFMPAQSSQRSGGESMMLSDDLEDNADHTFIWGTNLSVGRVQSRFTAFVHEFRETPEDAEPKYRQLLQEMRARGEASFNIDGRHLEAFDSTLYSWVVTYPSETVPIFDGQLSAIAAELEGVHPEDCIVQSRIFNLRETKVIRDLDPADINKLISISGMVTRTSSVIPDQSLALFRCMKCAHEHVEWNDRGRVNEPTKCPNPSCQETFAMQMIYNRSSFLDKQLMKMQENPNDIPEGETPHTVSLFARQDLVDLAKPGDRVTVTGVYRAVGIRVNPRLRELKSVYKTYLDVVHVKKEETVSLVSVLEAAGEETARQAAGASPAAMDAEGEEGEEAALRADRGAEAGLGTSNMTREEVDAKKAAFHALAASPDVYERLAASLAPSIWQLEDVKKGLLCQLFGGVSKALPGVRTRGEINVLLVGDPGVSKSQILGYVHKLAPRGMYTSGRGSSAVGLTAYVTRDPETREMVLESGALVLSDRGICCIDEFDKMSDAARSMLHEVMEQQTISVAKAGIIATLNARTSVLASANPVGSRYNPQLSVVDNIQLPPSLMSRFDLIYLLLDKPDEVTDRKLAKHLVSLFSSDADRSAEAPIPAQFLREYVAYARSACRPVLTDAAAAALANAYADMRAMGMSRKIVSATPRQLESLIRLSEAQARMRLRGEVLASDVHEAVRLMRVAMQQSSIDPRTGQIDMDIIQTGVSAADRTLKAQLLREVEALLEARAGGAGLRLAELLDALNAQASVHVSEKELRGALVQLEDRFKLSGGVVSARA